MPKSRRKRPADVALDAAPEPKEEQLAQAEPMTGDAQAPEEVAYDPAAGCLLRLFWMMLGNLLLLAASFSILQSPALALSLADLFYWLIVAALVAARYADIRYMNGCTTEGQPATLAHWHRYWQTLVAFSAGLWIILHLAAHFVA